MTFFATVLEAVSIVKLSTYNVNIQEIMRIFMKYTPTELGELLSLKAGELQISQKELEVQSGVSQPAISRILRGDFSRTSGNVAKVCAVLHIDVPTIRKEPKMVGRKSKLIQAEIDQLWDGSLEEEERVVELLKAMRFLRNAISK